MTETTIWTQPEPLPGRPIWRSLKRGFACRCPHCGQGRLFGKFLKVVDRCVACGEELHHHRADDAPPYFVIVIVGHIVVPLVLAVELAYAPPYWVHAALWWPLIVGLSLALLQPIKGAVVGWQWAHYMHGFDPNHTGDEDGPGWILPNTPTERP
jgi:uncharacterized protein (DUF983 family)